jgi:hypothetical protein
MSCITEWRLRPVLGTDECRHVRRCRNVSTFPERHRPRRAISTSLHVPFRVILINRANRIGGFCCEGAMGNCPVNAGLSRLPAPCRHRRRRTSPTYRVRWQSVADGRHLSLASYSGNGLPCINPWNGVNIIGVGANSKATPPRNGATTENGVPFSCLDAHAGDRPFVLACFDHLVA